MLSETTEQKNRNGAEAARSQEKTPPMASNPMGAFQRAGALDLTGESVEDASQTAPREGRHVPHFYFPDDVSAAKNAQMRKDGYPAHERVSSADANRYFNRSPRLRSARHKAEILIQKPPAVSGKPEINWLSVLLPPVAMAILVVLVGILSDGVSMYMLMMLPMQLASVVVAVVNYRKQMKKHTAYVSLRTRKYQGYLQAIQEKAEEAAARQLATARRESPAPEQCVEIVRNRKAPLWEREPEARDFGSFRIGTGTVPADVVPVWAESALTLVEDELETQAAALSQRYQQIDGAPIAVSGDSQIVGIVGDAASATALAKQIAVQLSTLHSYEDLKIGVVFSERDKGHWAWTRWLPHVQGEDNGSRLLAYSRTGASVLKEKLLDILQERTQAKEGNPYATCGAGPRYVLIVAEPDLFSGNDFAAKLAKAPDAGIRVLYLCRSHAQLPKECGHIIEVAGKRGVTYTKDNASERTAFAMDTLSEEKFEEFSRAMAAIRLEKKEAKGRIPDRITFFEGYGINRIENYDIGAAWRRGRLSDSFSVPIGIDENGERFYFDIQDGKHGVHGLIGGMSGSGKSEMLQTWILSMAMHFSPREISFVMIDFKGTGLITPFLGLPHLAGTISNINEARNIRRNKESLEYEMQKREVLFDKYGVQNIQSYIRLQRAGGAKEALPILFVIIDEFAELKRAFPEFMQWIESNFSKSRALGIWFILSTQQPANTASEAIKTNTHFKWCLKVNTAAASKEMLGIPDAAQITRPGRGYIKVDNHSGKFLTQVQSFWSGAPYSGGRNRGSGNQKLAVVDLNGNRIYQTGMDCATGYKTGQTEIEAAVAYIARYANRAGISSAARIWEERLAERIPLSAVCKEGFDGRQWPDKKPGLHVTIGEVDDPKHQTKYPLVVPFTDCGHIVVYGAPTTGKTTFLQTLVMSAALRYSPEDLNIYIMDFGSLSMRSFAAMPQVGGIAELGQDARISKLAHMLRDEMERRKALFAKYGVGNIEAYKLSPVAEKLPYILLVVDNFNSVLPTYPELDSFFAALTQTGASYGMYLAASATGVNGFSYKLQGNIKMAYALQMSDKSDYSLIVTKTDGLVPDNVMGRGLMRGNPPLQFQTALPAEGDSDMEITNAIRMIAEQMKFAWAGKPAKRIPEMPETIVYGSVEEEGIHLGLSSVRVEPVSYDYQNQHYLLISGLPRSGKSNLLKVIAMQMYDKLHCTLYVLDVKGGLKPLRDISTYIDQASEMDAFFDQLMPILKHRETARNAGETSFPPLLVVIDDFGPFFGAVNEKTARRLLAIMKLCSGLGVYLVAAGDAADLSTKRFMGEEVTMSFASGRQGVMLGGNPNDHGVFKLKLTSAQRNMEAEEKEGFYLGAKGLVRMKTMQEKL